MLNGALNRRRVLAACGTALVGGVAGCVQHLPVDKGVPNNQGEATIHVRPEGDFFNSGAEDDPLGSIGRAINVADPGDTVYVHSGEYVELVEANVRGDKENPVTLTGPEDAVLKPPEGAQSAALQINESHIHLTGLTITGLHNPDKPEDPASYHQGKLIGINADADGTDKYLEGLVVSPHRIGNAGQSLINSVQFKDSVIGGFKVIGPAGANWIFDDEEGHNGEIVYLGTAVGNRKERGYDSYDRTRNIRVHHIDNSEGHLHSELVDCKAGTENITIEYCTDGGGAKSNDSYYTRAISMDGTGCTIRWNVFRDIHGSGVRIGPQNYLNDINFVDSEPQTEYDHRLGTNHAIYENVFTGYTQEAVNFLRESQRPGRDTNPTQSDQRVICGNLYDGYSDGTPTNECTGSVPTSNGVGHLGGESPWGGPAPTKTTIFERHAQDLDLDVTVQKETVPTNTTFELPITITNNGEEAHEVTVRLRIHDYLVNEATVTVPAGEDQEITFTEHLPQVNDLEITRNGQKIASVRVADD